MSNSRAARAVGWLFATLQCYPIQVRRSLLHRRRRTCCVWLNCKCSAEGSWLAAPSEQVAALAGDGSGEDCGAGIGEDQACHADEHEPRRKATEAIDANDDDGAPEESNVYRRVGEAVFDGAVEGAGTEEHRGSGQDGDGTGGGCDGHEDAPGKSEFWFLLSGR